MADFSARPVIVDCAVQRGYLRHCPIGDDYEVIDQHVGIIGHGQTLASETLLLRTYTERLSVFGQPPGTGLSVREKKQLREAGARIIDTPVLDIATDAAGGHAALAATAIHHRLHRHSGRSSHGVPAPDNRL